MCIFSELRAIAFISFSKGSVTPKGRGQAVQAVYEDTDSGARKVVVTHWLADFSFSLPSVRHVIDSGLELRSVSERRVEGLWGLKTEIAHSHLSWPWLGGGDRFTILRSEQNPKY